MKKLLLLFMIPGFALAQSDSISIYRSHKQNTFHALLAPAILFGSGLAAMHQSHYMISSSDVQAWRQKNFSHFKTDADNYLPSASLVMLGALDLAGKKSENHWTSQAMIFVASNAFNSLITKTIKHRTNIIRPDGADHLSFPSMHTSSAFVAAEILHQEFRNESPWISATGYALASAVGAMRILNNRHWLSDVAAGAGIGILSVRITYFVFNKTLRKPLNHFRESIFRPRNHSYHLVT